MIWVQAASAEIDLNKIKTDPVVQKFLADNQPATNATAAKVIKTPIFIIQGANDQAYYL